MTEEDLELTDADQPGPRPRAVTELFRKVLVSGVGALFMTEEGLRSMVKELKLPKEMIGAVLAQADRTKGEVARVVGAEVRSFLRSTALRDDLLELLTRLRLEVRAEVGIKRRDEDGTLFEPAVKARVNVRQNGAAARPKKKPASRPKKKRSA